MAKHACRLTFQNSPGVMVFPYAAIVEADPAFKTESNRWLLRLRLGGAGAASLCLHSHDNTAQWALTTFQMEMEYPV